MSSAMYFLEYFTSSLPILKSPQPRSQTTGGVSKPFKKLETTAIYGFIVSS